MGKPKSTSKGWNSRQNQAGITSHSTRLTDSPVPFSPTSVATSPKTRSAKCWRVTAPQGGRHRTDRGWGGAQRTFSKPHRYPPNKPGYLYIGHASRHSPKGEMRATVARPPDWHMNMPDRLTSLEFHIPGQHRRNDAATRTCPPRRGRRLQSCSPHQGRSTSPWCGKPSADTVWNRISPSSGL